MASVKQKTEIMTLKNVPTPSELPAMMAVMLPLFLVPSLRPPEADTSLHRDGERNLTSLFMKAELPSPFQWRRVGDEGFSIILLIIPRLCFCRFLPRR